MAELRFKVPRALEEEVRNHPEVEWSDVVEKAIREELLEHRGKKLVLMALDKILANSTLTDDDCIRLGRKANKAVWEKVSKQYGL
jgi:hypothetical protein